MIRVAIAGYGRISRGIEYAVEQNRDIELAAVFTRRPEDVKPRTGVPVISIEKAAEWTDRVDVLILCGGSFSDLPEQGPAMAKLFNTVDSFDTHADIPKYFAKMDAALRSSGKLGLISSGWDPGLFSINRLYMSAVLPEGVGYTFWGKGISQGHSNALRQVEGVLDAVQYTCPNESAIERVRSGQMPELSTADKHIRECYVVLADGADAARVERDIVTMPNYFAGYKTNVHFITEEELESNHRSSAHGGFVFKTGKTGFASKTGEANTHVMEYSLKLDSNPEFTASVLVAYARAVARMAAEGKSGAITVFDVAPALLSATPAEQLRAEIL